MEGITFLRVSSLKVHLKQTGKLRPGGDDLAPSLTEAPFRASLTSLESRPAFLRTQRCLSRESPESPSAPPKLQNQVDLEAHSKARSSPGNPEVFLNRTTGVSLRGLSWSSTRDGLTTAGRRNETGRGWSVSEVAASRLGVKGVREVSEGAIPPAPGSRQALGSLPHSKVPRN